MCLSHLYVLLNVIRTSATTTSEQKYYTYIIVYHAYIIHILYIHYTYIIHILYICYTYIIHVLYIYYTYTIHMLYIYYTHCRHITHRNHIAAKQYLNPPMRTLDVFGGIFRDLFWGPNEQILYPTCFKDVFVCV